MPASETSAGRTSVMTRDVAATLPVFLLGLPSGALADILDRRRMFIFTQFWVAVIASLVFGTK